jgi:hypothetical protein
LCPVKDKKLMLHSAMSMAITPAVWAASTQKEKTVLPCNQADPPG